MIQDATISLVQDSSEGARLGVEAIRQNLSPSNRTIVAGSLEYPVMEWIEYPQTPPSAADPMIEPHQTEELKLKGIIVPNVGEATFLCDSTLAVGTSFMLKDTGQSFTVTAVVERQHRASRDLG